MTNAFPWAAGWAPGASGVEAMRGAVRAVGHAAEFTVARGEKQSGVELEPWHSKEKQSYSEGGSASTEAVKTKQKQSGVEPPHSKKTGPLRQWVSGGLWLTALVAEGPEAEEL